LVPYQGIILGVVPYVAIVDRYHKPRGLHESRDETLSRFSVANDGGGENQDTTCPKLSGAVRKSLWAIRSMPGIKLVSGVSGEGSIEEAGGADILPLGNQVQRAIIAFGDRREDNRTFFNGQQPLTLSSLLPGIGAAVAIDRN
jgi:hypothetical protein